MSIKTGFQHSRPSRGCAVIVLNARACWVFRESHMRLLTKALQSAHIRTSALPLTLTRNAPRQKWCRVLSHAPRSALPLRKCSGLALFGMRVVQRPQRSQGFTASVRSMALSPTKDSSVSKGLRVGGRRYSACCWLDNTPTSQSSTVYSGEEVNRASTPGEMASWALRCPWQMV